jgi:uncharacterized protein
MKNKKTVVIIHGGTTFRNQGDYRRYLKTRDVALVKKPRWSDGYLDKALGSKFEVLRPRMPLKENAKYVDWKIHWEKYLSHLRSSVILIGESLGGIFLAKYLATNKFPKKIVATYLVCPPYDNSLPEEDLVGGFRLPADLSRLEKNSPNLYLLFSGDDKVVPVSQAEKYRRKLPGARIIIYKSKHGHFRVSAFPEIIKMIKAAGKNYRKRVV